MALDIGKRIGIGIETLFLYWPIKVNLTRVVRKSPSSGLKIWVHSSLCYKDYLVSMLSSRCLLVAQEISASFDTKHVYLNISKNENVVNMVKSHYFPTLKRVIFSLVVML